MKEKANPFMNFFEAYATQINGQADKLPVYSDLDDIPLLPGQAIYVFDMKQLKVSYQRGIKNLLGYEPEEFNYDLLMTYYHPDDFDRYFHLVKIANEYIHKHKPDKFTVEVTLDFRLRKKDGSWLKVLRQSTIYENNPDNSMRSSFSILSDISNIKQGTDVNLKLMDVTTGKIAFEDKQSQPELPGFSARELEILNLLKLGHGSKSIAEKLHISRHTIDTHRRKMLNKAGARNVIELLQLATRMGII